MKPDPVCRRNVALDGMALPAKNEEPLAVISYRRVGPEDVRLTKHFEAMSVIGNGNVTTKDVLTAENGKASCVPAGSVPRDGDAGRGGDKTVVASGACQREAAVWPAKDRA